MSTSRTTRGAVAGAMVLGVALLSGCAGTPEVSEPVAQAVSEPAPSESGRLISGYPLDRSLKGLSEWPDLDTVVVLDEAEYLEPVRVDVPDPNLPDIVTPVEGVVSEALLGEPADGETVQFATAGGTIGRESIKAGEELAPDAVEVEAAPQVVVAGSLVDDPDLGTVLDPAFIYSVEGDTVTSLLESAGPDPYPSFTLDELRAAVTN